MGEAVGEARRRVELTREAVEADLARLRARLRAELDWRSRLRRDGPQLLAALGGVAVVGVAALSLRRALSRSRDGDRLADLDRVDLRHLALEVQDLRRRVERSRDGRRRGLVATLAGAAVAAAVEQGSRAAAQRLAEAAEHRSLATR